MGRYEIKPPLLPFEGFIRHMQPDSYYADEFQEVTISLTMEEAPPDLRRRTHMVQRRYTMVLETEVSIEERAFSEHSCHLQVHHRVRDALFTPFRGHILAAIRAVQDRKAKRADQILKSILQAIEEL